MARLIILSPPHPPSSSADHREVLELEYRCCLLELEKAELDQARLLHERVMSQVRLRMGGERLIFVLVMMAAIEDGWVDGLWHPRCPPLLPRACCSASWSCARCACSCGRGTGSSPRRQASARLSLCRQRPRHTPLPPPAAAGGSARSARPLAPAGRRLRVRLCRRRRGSEAGGGGGGGSSGGSGRARRRGRRYRGTAAAASPRQPSGGGLGSRRRQ